MENHHCLCHRQTRCREKDDTAEKSPSTMHLDVQRLSVEAAEWIIILIRHTQFTQDPFAHYIANYTQYIIVLLPYITLMGSVEARTLPLWRGSDVVTPPSNVCSIYECHKQRWYLSNRNHHEISIIPPTVVRTCYLHYPPQPSCGHSYRRSIVLGDPCCCICSSCSCCSCCHCS